MATVTLSGNSNLSALSFSSGDTIQTAGFTLTIDQTATCSIATNNAAGKITVGSGTFTITGNISSSVTITGNWFTVGTGSSLTLNGVLTAWTGNASNVMFSLTGGTLVVNAGSSTTTFASITAGCIVNQSGGTLNFTGSNTIGGNSQIPWVQSGGTSTFSGSDTYASAGNQYLTLSGAANYSRTGNITQTGIISSTGVISVGGASVVGSMTGTLSNTGGGSANNGININFSGAQWTHTGNMISGSRGMAANITAGTLTWANQTVTVGSGQELEIQVGGTGSLNISGLIINNSGKVSIDAFYSSTITTNGTTALNNLTSTASGAVTGANITVTNTASTVQYMPSAGQVQSGVVFGYSGATLTGTGATIDVNALSTALVTALGTGSGFTALMQAAAYVAPHNSNIDAIYAKLPTNNIADETLVLAAIGTPLQTSSYTAPHNSNIDAIFGKLPTGNIADQTTLTSVGASASTAATQATSAASSAATAAAFTSGNTKQTADVGALIPFRLLMGGNGSGQGWVWVKNQDGNNIPQLSDIPSVDSDAIADAVVAALSGSTIIFTSPLSQDGKTLEIVTGDSYSAALGTSLTFQITNQPGLIGSIPHLRITGAATELAVAPAIISGTQQIVFGDVLTSQTIGLFPTEGVPYQIRFMSVDSVDVCTPLQGFADITKGI